MAKIGKPKTSIICNNSATASRARITPSVLANGSRVGFLSGLVTIESGMIALIDLPNLLSIAVEEEAPRLAS